MFMDFDLLEKYLVVNHQPAFRFKQIKQGFFKQQLSGFDQITSLPYTLRKDLASKFPWLLVKVQKTVGSPKQSVVKALFQLNDNHQTESVLMFYRHWLTACLSVMSGCPLKCRFCATGQMGFARNLNCFEIVDQVVFWNLFLKKEKKLVNRVVFMGMGEPFLNWENVWQAIGLINNPNGLNIGQRHITISTVGVVPGIYHFAKLETQINLAISLHSPFQEKREMMIPIAKKYSLSELLKAAEDYIRQTKRKLFFEYALIDGFNDRPEDVKELRKIFTSPLFHLNLLRLNPTLAKIKPSGEVRLRAFIKELKKNKIPFTLRRSLGEKIQAACGQLACLPARQACQGYPEKSKI